MQIPVYLQESVSRHDFSKRCHSEQPLFLSPIVASLWQSYNSHGYRNAEESFYLTAGSICPRSLVLVRLCCFLPVLVRICLFNKQINYITVKEQFKHVNGVHIIGQAISSESWTSISTKGNSVLTWCEYISPTTISAGCTNSTRSHSSATTTPSANRGPVSPTSCR